MSNSIETTLIKYRQDLENLDRQFKTDLRTILLPEIESTLLEPTVMHEIRLHLISKYPYLKNESTFNEDFLKSLLLMFIKQKSSGLENAIGSQVSLDYYVNTMKEDSTDIAKPSSNITFFDVQCIADDSLFKRIKYKNAIYQVDNPISLSKLLQEFSTTLLLERVVFDLTDPQLVTKLHNECKDINFNIVPIQLLNEGVMFKDSVSLIKDVSHATYLMIPRSHVTNKNIYKLLKVVFLHNKIDVNDIILTVKQ